MAKVTLIPYGGMQLMLRWCSRSRERLHRDGYMAINKIYDRFIFALDIAIFHLSVYNKKQALNR